MSASCGLRWKRRWRERGGTSGRDELQVEQIVSDLFTSRTGKVGKGGIRVPGPPFKFKCLARFLANHPKSESSSAVATRQKVGNGQAKDVETEPCDSVKDGSRPMGIKKRKKVEQDQDERRKIRKEMRALKHNIQATNDMLAATAARDQRAFLLGVLRKNRPQYRSLLDSVYEQELNEGGAQGSEESGCSGIRTGICKRREAEHDEEDGDISEN